MKIKQTGQIQLTQTINKSYTFIIPVSITTDKGVNISSIKGLYYYAGEGWVPLCDDTDSNWETFFEDPYEDNVLEIINKFCTQTLSRFFEDDEFTQRIFVVSTAHITQTDAQLLYNNNDSTLIVDKYPGGYIIHPPIDDDKIPDEYSDAFKNLIKLTKTLGYNFLKLDQDGSVYPDIETFD